MKLKTSVAVIAAAAALLIATIAQAQDAPSRKSSVAAPKAQLLKVYEWGADTMAWDGSPEPEFDAEVPALYYDASEVPISAPIPDIENPVEEDPDEPPPRISGRKPVIYFDCPSDVIFDLDVTYTSGRITWMYPKPNRRTSAATAQWDNIQLYSDAVTRKGKLLLPGLCDVPADHWANYSRDGSSSSLVVNGENERFVFYEGEPDQHVEADVFKDAHGKLVFRNYGAHELRDVRICLKLDARTRAWHLPKVDAGANGSPHDVKLEGMAELDWAAAAKSGTLAPEVETAGLTAAQAKVFDRAWRRHFFSDKGNVLTYRRTQAALDERVKLTVKASGQTKTESTRIGYVFMHDIDLSRQADLDALVAKALDGDSAAAQELARRGSAAAGAVRRVQSDTNQTLARRLGASKLLKTIGGK